MKTDKDYIIILRKNNHWTQEELAIVSGLSARTIQRVEQSGQCSLETLRALSGAFNLSVDELLYKADSDIEDKGAILNRRHQSKSVWLVALFCMLVGMGCVAFLSWIFPNSSPLMTFPIPQHVKQIFLGVTLLASLFFSPILLMASGAMLAFKKFKLAKIFLVMSLLLLISFAIGSMVFLNYSLISFLTPLMALYIFLYCTLFAAFKIFENKARGVKA